MNKFNLSTFAKSMRASISKHSPEILTGIGIAGMVTTTILAVKATPKAIKLVEAKKEELDREKIKPVDVVKVTWKCYIPAAITCATSIACLIGANSVHLRRNAALAAAYKISETALTEYREKVVETVGEKKEQAIREKVAHDRLEKNPINQSNVYVTGKGNTLFLDSVTHRFFMSDREVINRAINKVNYDLTHDILGFVSLNEFYDEIGLESCAIGDHIGWRLDNGKGLMEVDFTPDSTDDGSQPCFVLDYGVVPDYDHSKWY